MAPHEWNAVPSCSLKNNRCDIGSDIQGWQMHHADKCLNDEISENETPLH